MIRKIFNNKIPIQPSQGQIKGKKKDASSACEDGFTKSAQKAEEKEWTILAYLAGANDLKRSITKSFKEMEGAGSNDKVNVVAYLARDDFKPTVSFTQSDEKPVLDDDWNGSRIYYVTKGDPDSGKITSTLLEDRGREKVRDPENLQRFIEMGMKKYPAKHYAVFINSHGGGPEGVIMDRDAKFMPLPDVKKALNTASENAGKEIDVLGMEACHMGQVETAYEFKDTAKFMVASPGRTYDSGFNYEQILGALDAAHEQGEEVTPEVLAWGIIELSPEYQDENGLSNTPTLTALNLKKMEPVRDSLSGLADALSKTDTPKDVIKDLIFESPQHDTHIYKRAAKLAAKGREQAGSDLYTGKMERFVKFIDVLGFCDNLEKSDQVTDVKVKRAAKDLKKSIGDAVINKKVQYTDQDNMGLAFYMPTAKNHLVFLNKDYDQLDISKEGKWDDYLRETRGSVLKNVTRFLASKVGLG